MPNFVQMSAAVHCVAGERLIQFATEHLVTEVLIHPQVHFLKSILNSNQSNLLTIAGEHFAAMYEEHAGKLHKASSHPTRWIHLRRSRVLDTAGWKYLLFMCKFLCIIALYTLFVIFPGWDLFLRGLCLHI